MQPQGNDPQYDFMLKNNQPVKGSGFSFPRLGSPLRIGLIAAGVIILLIIVSSVLSGHKKGSTTDILGALARGQETLRETAYVQNTLQPQDPQTLALAATVTSSLSSDQQQLVQYLANNHAKVSPAQLAIDTDKTSDDNLQQASQNNNLPQAYVTYVQGALNQYKVDLQTAYNAAGPKGKVILKNAFDSANTLLSNAPLKS